jgi:hypothetical protein
VANTDNKIDTSCDALSTIKSRDRSALSESDQQTDRVASTTSGLFEAVPSPLDETALQIHLMEQEVGIVKMNQCRWSHTISR